MDHTSDQQQDPPSMSYSNDTFTSSIEEDEAGSSPLWWNSGASGQQTPLHESRFINRSKSVPETPRGDSIRDQLLNPSKYHNKAHNRTLFFCDSYHSKYANKHPKGWLGVWRFFESPTLLIMIGIFSSCSGAFLDFFVTHALQLRTYLSSLGFIPFIFSAASFGILSTLIVQMICPQAAGSGLPEMKVAISGVIIKEYLSMRCLLAKSLGLITAFAAGLSIGREGPFILLSCSFADQIMHLSIFERILNNSSKRLEILACGCAAGVAATFGTPFGGVLFSLEVTSTFYMVRNLPRSFFCAILGAIIVRSFGEEGASLYSANSISNVGLNSANTTKKYTFQDLVVFSCLGCACGLLGALMIYLISLLVRLRDWLLPTNVSWSKDTRNRVMLVLIMTIVVNTVEYFGDRKWFLEHGGASSVLADIFSDKKMENMSVISKPFLVFLPLKYILTTCCVVLPIPAGIFAPAFVIGGIFGRLIGQLIHIYFPGATAFHPFEFAIVGAAAFTTGVTRAISTAVIIMEISRHDYLHLPVSLGILAAYFTGNRFVQNVYDVLITSNKLPQLKKLPKDAYDIPTWEVMKEVSEMNYLVADCTYNDCKKLLEQSSETVFAIVDNHINMILLGAVTRARIKAVLRHCQEKETQAGSKPPPTRELSQTFMDTKLPQEKQGFGASRSQRTSIPSGISIPAPNLMNWPVQFAVEQGGVFYKWDTQDIVTRTKLTLVVNPAPYQIVEGMPMEKVDLIFRMLKLSNAYVTRCGQLVGVITRDRLANFLSTASSQYPSVIATTVTTFIDGVYSCICRRNQGYKSIE